MFPVKRNVVRGGTGMRVGEGVGDGSGVAVGAGRVGEIGAGVAVDFSKIGGSVGVKVWLAVGSRRSGGVDCGRQAVSARREKIKNRVDFLTEFRIE
jgi:hypothetical protein